MVGHKYLLEKHDTLSSNKGNVWREQRKLFHSQFQESVAPDYMPLQVKSAQDVARKILADPDELLEHLHMQVFDLFVAGLKVV